MEMVKVGEASRILSTTLKAIQLEVGLTYQGDVITTWYPKSLIRLKRNDTTYDIYVPEWANHSKMCNIGSYLIPEDIPDMLPYTDEMVCGY